MLALAWPGLEIDVEILRTRGDDILDKPLPQIGGKGLFTAELEAALRSGAIDLAVHSLKDLPTEDPAGLTVGALPTRFDASDVLISRSGLSLDRLPPGAAIGTSSRRRAAQVRYRYPHLQVIDIRGNVDSRIRKALDADGPYDAIIVARAGVERLGRGAAVTQVLPHDLMLPAPGQGALAVQCRDERSFRSLLSPLEDRTTRVAVTAERAFLSGLGGGCAVPIAAFAECRADRLFVRGRVTALDGSTQIDVSLEGAASDAVHVGRRAGRPGAGPGSGSLAGGGRGMTRARPLHGRRIVVTQAAHQAAEFSALLCARGAVPLLYPCIAIAPVEDTAPLDAALRGAAEGAFDWLVLTSANTVHVLAGRLAALEIQASALASLRVAAIGHATAQAVTAELGLAVVLVA